MNTAEQSANYEAKLRSWAKAESNNDPLSSIPRPTLQEFRLSPDDWIVKKIHQTIKREFPNIEL